MPLPLLFAPLHDSFTFGLDLLVPDHRLNRSTTFDLFVGSLEPAIVQKRVLCVPPSLT
jgi:hypothetical protein